MIQYEIRNQLKHTWLCRWAQSRALTLSLLALISLCSTTVSSTAAAANKRVAVYVVGPGGEGLSAELVLALPAGVGVIESSKLVDALAEQHIKNLGAALNSARQRKTLIDPLRAAAKAIGADAIVLGGVPERKTDRDNLQLVVLVTSESGVAVDERVPLANKAARSERFQALVGEKLHELGAADGSDAKTGPPDASGAGQANTSEAPAAAAEAEAEAGPATLRTFSDALLAGFIGLDLGGRQMHYRDRVTNANLRPYDLPQSALLPVAPGIAASAEIFPFASKSWPFLRDLGVSGRANYNIVSSKVGAVSLSTKAYAWEANLRGRYLFGPRSSAPRLGLELGLGRQTFTFSTPGPTQDTLASVDYHYVHLGVDGRIPFGTKALILGAGYRDIESRLGRTGNVVPSAGLLGEHFPRAKISGLDGKIGGSYALTETIEARIVLNYSRYWGTLNPRTNATYIAGGSLDQMLNLDLGVAAFF